MQGQIERIYENGQLQEYVSELLTLGLCPVFLSEHFINDCGEVKGICRTEGYRSLSFTENLGADEILSVVIGLLHGVFQAEKHFVFSETFCIVPDDIYVNEDFSEVRLLYMPDRSSSSLKDKLLALLSFLHGKCREEEKGYIENAETFTAEEVYGYKSLIRHFENLRREIYLCSANV